MRYISTRAIDNLTTKSFCAILLEGLAPDGGLYLPEKYPEITEDELSEWRNLSYADLAFVILSKFIDDIPAADLKDILDKTYTAKTYAFSRDKTKAPEITPLTFLEKNLCLQELSNGPTLAFKDMAMQFLGNVFEYVLARENKKINILGATSGDTGSAAEYAMRGKENIRVFMLSPNNRMSAFQRAQMYSLPDKNIINLAVNGLFDDAQDIVKAVSNDLIFKEKYKIGAVNSINWARVLAQVVYYFKGYFAATKSNEESVDFAVPSGNFGNICAGHIARMMGLPIARLILATNENDVLDEFFHTGAYRPRSSENTFITSSPSMDISKASNFERFIFDLVGRNGQTVRNLWAEIEEEKDNQGEKGFDLSNTSSIANLQQYGFCSGKSNHQDRLKTIAQSYEKYGILVDTHTADALKVAAEFRHAERTMIVLETAQAAKFEETIIEAIGKKPERPEILQNIENLPQRVQVIDIDVEKVKNIIRQEVDVK